MTGNDADQVLLADVARGDQAAARRLVAEKLPRLIALGVRLLGDHGEAEDVAQETFVRTWRKAPRWKKGSAQLDTWMHTVALNLCRDRIRRRQRIMLGDVPDSMDPSLAADIQIEKDQRGIAVAEALARLPERQREALVLQCYQELSNLAAAEVMGISVEALESLLSRGRRRLRELLIEQKS